MALRVLKVYWRPQFFYYYYIFFLESFEHKFYNYVMQCIKAVARPSAHPSPPPPFHLHPHYQSHGGSCLRPSPSAWAWAAPHPLTLHCTTINRQDPLSNLPGLLQPLQPHPRLTVKLRQALHVLLGALDSAQVHRHQALHLDLTHLSLPSARPHEPVRQGQAVAGDEVMR